MNPVTADVLLARDSRNSRDGSGGVHPEVPKASRIAFSMASGPSAASTESRHRDDCLAQACEWIQPGSGISRVER